MSQQTLLEDTRQTLTQMLRLLGMDAHVNAQDEEDAIQLVIETDDPGRVIGRRGETLRNLQHLLNAMRLNQVSDHPRIRIDVESDQRRSPRRSSAEARA